MTGPHNTAPPVGRQDARTPDWALPGVQEFVPGRLDPSALVSLPSCLRLSHLQWKVGRTDMVC